MNSAGQGRNRFAISHLPAQFGAEDFSDILPKPPISRIFGKYNHVVRTFVANTADHSFRVRIWLHHQMHLKRTTHTEVSESFILSVHSPIASSSWSFTVTIGAKIESISTIRMEN